MEDTVSREPGCEPGYGAGKANLSLRTGLTVLTNAASLQLAAGGVQEWKVRDTIGHQA
jgi:hypothetical protein